MDLREEALRLHQNHQGKLEVRSLVPINDTRDLSLAYTPGVAAPCLEIAKDIENVYRYTRKSNLVAIITDGSAVLGLGNIGPEASMPVMEGKAVLFKEFAGIDAFPIYVSTSDVDEIVHIVKNISVGFGGINLEDISAPRCFEIEKRLKNELSIPVFHDDQHGTAVVVLAALKNSLKIVGKSIDEVKIVINGAGAAGTAISKLLMSAGAENILLCDRDGVLYKGKPNMLRIHEEIAGITNKFEEKGTLSDVIAGADVFIGVSAAGVLTAAMATKMAKRACVFALANPVPEILPEEALKANVEIIGTGRSDYPNQINNVLAFPGIFRGALNVRATEINDEMKLAAASALADLVGQAELSPQCILPNALDKRVVAAVADAVSHAARRSASL